MGFFSDLLFGKKQKKTYQGGQELLDTYSQASQLQAPDYRELMGQVGGGTLTSAAKDYMTRVLGGEGQNPYETEAFQKYEQATMGRVGERLGEAAQKAGAAGMLRGSGSANMASNVMTEANRGLAEQGFAAQQAGLQRQYGMAQFAPGLEMEETQQKAALMNQGYQDLMSKISLQGNLSQAINSMYDVQKRSGGLMGAIAPIAGAIFGGPIGGALAGRVFRGGGGGGLLGGIFNRRQQRQQNYAFGTNSATGMWGQ
jgi:hypothetical protein